MKTKNHFKKIKLFLHKSRWFWLFFFPPKLAIFVLLQWSTFTKLALNQIVASWKMQPSIQFHGSGWIVFQFATIEDQTKVLENGPYLIYGSPLLLKPMPKYFSFGMEEISTVPVWVQLRNVPFDFVELHGLWQNLFQAGQACLYG